MWRRCQNCRSGWCCSARHTPNDVADIDIVSACGQIGAGAIAQGGVVATGVVEERYITTGCVAVASV